ncbi:hypothetical protein ABZ863_11370 [Saccharomonospora sp. NPDC046836]|uniref:hypothetical protein n=1 Tax=Saccharomonospora sp. NPDC046836 TaxID=3156921 RepID=UPI0033E82897
MRGYPVRARVLLALRTTFDQQRAAGRQIACELRFGADRFHVRVDGGTLTLSPRPTPST